MGTGGPLLRPNILNQGPFKYKSSFTSLGWVAFFILSVTSWFNRNVQCVVLRFNH